MSNKIFTVHIDDPDVVAFDTGGNEIGRFEIAMHENDKQPPTYFAYAISVNEHYRRKGVGTALVQEAMDYYDNEVRLPGMNTPGGSNATDSCDYFTQEGAKLFWHCLKLGIVKDYQFADYEAPDAYDPPDDHCD